MAIIELKNVKKTYPLGKLRVEAVKGVSFEIEKGDFISIAGPSGSGKSTILNMIGCIDRPTEGIVEIQGKPTQDLSDRAVTSLRHDVIGFIFQSFNLIPVLDVYENIEFPLLLGRERMTKKEKTEWIDFLIEEVGLTQWRKHRPNELSGGQRQRVAIARALAAKPQIVLADEPTANLDSKTGEQIIELMKKINRDMETTFIFSTHNAKIVTIADHVIRLMDGLVQREHQAGTDHGYDREREVVMSVLIRIALRNILEHKSKSFIIGIIIAVGVLVIVDGNAFLDRAQVGIKKTFTENFTGDIYVYGKAKTPTSILFGQMDSSGSFETPLLPDFNELASYINEQPEVENATGLVTTIALFNLEDKGEIDIEKEKDGEETETSMLGGAILMGIDPVSYHAMFDNVTMLEGTYLEPGQEGLMLSKTRLDMVNKLLKVQLKLGDEIIMQGFGGGGFKSRKAKITGIFQSNAESDANEFMAFTDVNTVRLLAGLTVGGAGEVEISESTKALISRGQRRRHLRF